MEKRAEIIRKDIRDLVDKYEAKVNFEEWDRKEGDDKFTMIRAVMTFKIED